MCWYNCLYHVESVLGNINKHIHIVLVQLFVSCWVSWVNNITTRRIVSSSGAVYTTDKIVPFCIGRTVFLKLLMKLYIFLSYDARSVIFLQQWLYCMNIHLHWCLLMPDILWRSRFGLYLILSIMDIYPIFS